MGPHRSQKRVISRAGSFPLLNNGALILGFPGLSSIDFGIEDDCVYTWSRLMRLSHLFPPVYPHRGPCVPALILTQGTHHSAPPGLGEAWDLIAGCVYVHVCPCTCVCAQQSPVTSGCLSKSAVGLPAAFVPREKSPKPPSGNSF